jgi:acetolactate synthase-1/2/3 large subunit
MYSERISSVDDLPGAFDRAMKNRPALLDVLVTPDAKSSDAKTGLAWVPDLQALAAWDDAEKAWRQN